MRRVVVVDKFSKLTPYWLETHSHRFDELVAEVRENPDAFTYAWREPDVREVEDTFEPPKDTRAYAAGPDGSVVLWKER